MGKPLFREDRSNEALGFIPRISDLASSATPELCSHPATQFRHDTSRRKVKVTPTATPLGFGCSVNLSG